MPFTNMERTFLKGGRSPHQAIRSNPYQVKAQPAKANIWLGKGTPATTGSFAQEQTMKGIKDRTTANRNLNLRSLAASPKLNFNPPAGAPNYKRLLANAPRYAKNYAIVRSPLDIALAAHFMSRNYNDQIMKADPRDRAALAYQSSTGASMPESREAYDNMQQSFLSGGATHYNWDQFNPEAAFNYSGPMAPAETPRAVVSSEDMDDYNLMQAERARYGY
jgi:hypothetical protein